MAIAPLLASALTFASCNSGKTTNGAADGGINNRDGVTVSDSGRDADAASHDDGGVNGTLRNDHTLLGFIACNRRWDGCDIYGANIGEGLGVPKKIGGIDNMGYLSYTSPKWAPDGSRLAFVDQAYGLYIMDYPIGETMQVMQPDGHEFLGSPDFSWSSNGNQIIYSTGPDPCSAQSNRGELNVINAEQVVDPRLIYASPDGIYSAIWSSSANKIFMLINDTDHEGFDGGVYSVEPDGSNLSLIFGLNIRAVSFALSPDESRVVLSTCANGIILVDVNNPRNPIIPDITNALDGTSLSWSADGALIAFESRDGDGTAIRVMDSNGNNQRTILESFTGKPFIYQPSWYPLR